MGFTEEAIRQELEWDKPVDVEIWPEHIEAWELFKAVQRRWDLPAMGSRPIGLNAYWVELKAKLMFPGKQKRRRRVVEQMEMIEAGALEAWPTARQ